MADVRIDLLPNATALSGGEAVPIVQSGAGVQVTTANIAALGCAWPVVSGKPTTLTGYGITDPIVLDSGSYADPAWIVSLSWSKLVSKPTTLSGYGIADAVSSTATQGANQVFSGPASGTPAAPTFRALVAADLPTLTWSMITATPTTLAGYGITDAVQNPMTTAGDIIAAGASGAPQRLAAGTVGQVLTMVSGSPAWQAAYSNPMTTAGDIVIGGTSGVAIRLAGGSAGQVLTFISGAPSWAPLAPAWSSVTGTPTTLAGYGITDAESLGQHAGINDQTGTTYTLVATDKGKDVRCTNTAAVSLIVPPNSSVAFPIGTVILFSQGGTGAVSAVSGSGVTLRAANGVSTTSQYDARGLEKTDSDTWRVW